ncbi:MAG: DNRLRE domain-containing protein [Pseudomonadota bacterium]
MLVGLLAGATPGVVLGGAAQQLTLTPAADNSLFEEGDLSNGAGVYLFTGRIATGPRRRALLRFDFSAIPAGSTIESVTLDVSMSRTISGTLTVRAHRLLADWGEGTSDAPGQEGTGIAAGPNDATWAQRRGGQPWSTPGGDFAVLESGRSAIRDVGRYQFAGAGLAADVQSFVDDPANNFGWILIGNEGAGFGSAKRLNSRENPDLTTRPVLTVTFQPGAAPPPPAVAVPVLGPGALLALALALLAGGLRGVQRRGSSQC